MDTMDVRLTEFARLHHIDLLRRTSYQANRFRDEINEQHFVRQLSSYQLTSEQVTPVDADLRASGDSLCPFRMTRSND
jgi:hypothetical protein